MIIIQDVLGTLPMYHKLGSVNLNDDAISVAVTSTSALPMVGPGGVLQPFVGGNHWDIPAGAISPENVSQRAIAEWLVSEAGPYPGAIISSDADFPWRSSRAALLAKARIKRDKVRSSVCTVEIGGQPVAFETDSESRGLITGAALQAFMAEQAGEPFAMDWRVADNSVVTLDAPQMIALGKAVAQFVAAGQARKNELDALIASIDATTSEEDVNAIERQIDEGWPS